ncbi:hypothetical protein COCNU_scaffold023184G000020 [Cocos nucifera]|nr:hypothetical protein [Cocos nucifera]
MGASEIAFDVEVPPTIESGPVAKAINPLMLSSLPTKIQVLEPSLGREKEARKKGTKRALRKSQRKARHNGPNSPEEEIGENPFNNHEVV